MLVFGVVALGPAFSAGFVLIDDHEILSYTDGAKSNSMLGSPPDLVHRLLVDEPANGRTRPLYWILRTAEIAVLDTHPGPWHALYVCLGLASSGLAFTAMRAIGISRLAALMCSAWLLVAPRLSEVWIRLGPQESIGTFLLVLAFFAAANGARMKALWTWDWLFVVTLSAATLVKESFTLVLTAVIGLRLLLRYQRRGRAGLRGASAVVPSAVPLLIGLGVLVVSFLTAQWARQGTYGNQILHASALDVDQLLINLEILVSLGAFVVPLLALGPVIEWVRRQRPTPGVRGWFAGALLVSLLVVPQLLLYRGAPGFVVGRYLLPTGLGLALGVAAGIDWLRQRRYRILSALATALWLVLLSVFAVSTWRDAEVFQLDSAQLARAVELASAAAASGGTVAIATDPVKDQELAISFAYHLAALSSGKSPDIRVLLVPLPEDDPAQFQSRGSNLVDYYFAGHGDVPSRGCDSLASVVLLAPEPATRKALACLEHSGMVTGSFYETVELPGWIPKLLHELLPPVRVGYSVMVK